MQTAIEICKSEDRPFAEVFMRQYRLSRDAPPLVQGWVREKISNWWLTHCPRLFVRKLEDNRGLFIGWLLGTPVEKATRAIDTSPYRINDAQDSSAFWSTVETQITEMAGSYAAIVLTPDDQRMYFDPIVNVPAVFHAKTRTVAASPLMALSRPMRTNFRVRHDRIIASGGNYGMQQTCDPEVFRVMANHYLDLETFTLHRHWPGVDDTFEAPEDATDENAHFIVDRLGKICGALLSQYTCNMPLSGGADSRTLVYAARDHLHRVQHFYSHRTNKMTGVDCLIASKLAKDLGHDIQLIDAWRTLQGSGLTDEMIAQTRWDTLQRTGFMAPPSDNHIAASHMTPGADLSLRGNVMDMSKANQWPVNMEVSLEHGVFKLAIGGRAERQNVLYWGAEYSNWIDTLPDQAKPRLYEFAFLELLLPQTLSWQLIAQPQVAYVNPFNCRKLITACMSIDPKIRKSGAFNAALHRAAGTPDIGLTGQVKFSMVRGKIRKLFAAA